MTKQASTSSDKTANPGTAALQLDKQLCFALYATSLAMTKLYRPLLQALELTYPQYLVMLALWQHGELSVGQLGEKVALDSGTLVPLIRKLAALDLISRQRSLADDRSVLISLTAKGVALRQQTDMINEQVRCATHYTDAQRQALVCELQALRVSLLKTVATTSKVRK